MSRLFLVAMLENFVADVQPHSHFESQQIANKNANTLVSNPRKYGISEMVDENPSTIFQ